MAEPEGRSKKARQAKADNGHGRATGADSVARDDEPPISVVPLIGVELSSPQPDVGAPVEQDREAADAGQAERLARIARLYAVNAGSHDMHAAAAEPIRRRAVAALELEEGAVVLDVACGTGLSFAPLEQAIGPSGRIVGLDLSPQMLERARSRCDRSGWDNVDLVETSIEEADLSAVEPDALLISFAHDVTQSPEALANVLGQARPGTRVAVVGAKWAAWWAPGMNSYLWTLAAQYSTTFDGLARPWGRLSALVPDLHVETLLFGGAYLASGRTPA